MNGEDTVWPQIHNEGREKGAVERGEGGTDGVHIETMYRETTQDDDSTMDGWMDGWMDVRTSYVAQTHRFIVLFLDWRRIPNNQCGEQEC